MHANRLDLRIDVAADPAAVIEAAARDIAGYLRRRLAVNDAVSIALSGGGTPGPLYERLTRYPYRYAVDWRRVRVFWVDERCVPPYHADSNFRLVAEAFLDRLPQLPEVFRMPGELAPRRGAGAYRRILAAEFGPGVPRLDLVILGMGGDAHTASLFPGSAALDAPQTVLATRSPLPPPDRLTLGLRVLNAAGKAVFLVHGGGKADILAKVIASARKSGGDGRYPSARIRPAGPVTWFVDRAAAAKILA